MKRVSFYLICLLVLSGLISPAYAKAVIYVYGLNQAKIAHGPSNRTYYISLGAFSKRQHANQLLRAYRSAGRGRAVVSFKQGYYRVLLGPFHSAQAVRTFAYHSKPEPRYRAERSHAARSSLRPYREWDSLPVPAQAHVNWNKGFDVRPVKPVVRYQEPVVRSLPPPPPPPIKTVPKRVFTMPAFTMPAFMRPSFYFPKTNAVTHNAGPAQSLGHSKPKSTVTLSPASGQYDKKEPNGASFILKNLSPVATLSLGASSYSSQTNQTFYLQQDIQKTYEANNSTDTLGNIEFFLGTQQSLGSRLTGELGLVASGTTNAALSGFVWEDADPDFKNFTYQYKLNHAYLGAKAKLLAKTPYYIQPYLNGSLGVSWNQAYDYVETPLPFQEISAPPFTNNTTTAFSYTAGAGLQTHFNTQWSLGIEYEFADWGESHLGRAENQTLNTGLSLSHFYTNSLFCTLSYKPKDGLTTK
ncbi:MAG: outer membrane beta-barrel protein [Gammaproteobacteria bacterium]|nr:outer membrane beta-barrel protein [Gammaproteobacteria bacterium]